MTTSSWLVQFSQNPNNIPIFYELNSEGSMQEKVILM
jgi:hypothetical protein